MMLKGSKKSTLRHGLSRLNPFSWRKSTVRRLLFAFYAIGLPVYLFIGLQPADAHTSVPSDLNNTSTRSASVASDSAATSASATTSAADASANSATATSSSSSSSDPSVSIHISGTTPTLIISSIGLSTPVQPLTVSNHTLETPDTIAGSYSSHKNKTLLIGHSSTVFQRLPDVRIGDEILYKSKTYRVIRRELALKESINMRTLLQEEKDDLIVLMTCAGEPLGGRDSTHRLLITAIEAK